MRRAALAGVILLAAFATACGGHQRAAGGTILFQSDRSGRDAWYAVRPDGTGLSRIPLRLPLDGADVYWNGHGTRALVVYDTGNGSATVAYVFDAMKRTRHRIRLPGIETISQTPWSPDGKRLVLYTRGGDVVFDAETGTSQPLSDENADDLLTWSPDGKRLLFSSGRDLYTAPAAGGPPTHVMRLHRLPGDYRWSADGSWISFVDEGLYVVRANGTGLRSLDPGAEDAAWSPTGEKLVFVRPTGLVLVDFETGRRRQLTRDQLGGDPQEPAWSPDGKRIVYLRPDLVSGEPYGHAQVWTVKADGTGKRPVTHAFPDDGSVSNASAQWVDGNVNGTPPPRQPLVALRTVRTLTTRFPIVSLAAEDNRAAVAQGFGSLIGGPRSQLGPIVVWKPARGTQVRVRVRGCARVDDVLLATGRIAYRCDNAAEGYTVRDSLRLGTTTLVRTHGEEFSGSFLGGLVADHGTVAFDVGYAAGTWGKFRIRQTRIWASTGTRTRIVRSFGGYAAVAWLDAGRIAVRRGRNTVSVLLPGGAVRTYAPGGPLVLGAALDGPRLLVLQSARLTAFDLKNGRRTRSWPLRRGFGPAPQLEDAQGDLVAYVVGVAVHVLRLTDGRELVIDTPNATAPVFARFVPSGLFYSFDKSYDKRPGRLVFVTHSELARALRERR